MDREQTLKKNLEYLVAKGFMNAEERERVLGAELLSGYSISDIPGSGQRSLAGVSDTGTWSFDGGENPAAESENRISMLPIDASGAVVFGLGLGYDLAALLDMRPGVKHVAIIECEPALYREALGLVPLWEHPEIQLHLWIGDLSKTNVERFSRFMSGPGGAAPASIRNRAFQGMNRSFIERFSITMKFMDQDIIDNVGSIIERIRGGEGARIYSGITADYLCQSMYDVMFPLVLRVESTNRCNLRCTICPTCEVPADRKGSMDLSLFAKILEELATLHPPSLYYLILYLGGEPLMNRNLPEMVSMASAAGMRTHVNTNGMLLTQELSEKLIAAGLHTMKFSFDDMPPEKFNEIRQGSDYWKVYENIKDFCAVKERMGAEKPGVTIAALKLPEDDEGPVPKLSPGFRKMFDGMKVDFECNRIHNWASDYKAGVEGVAEPEQGEYYSCKMLWGEMTIRWDGTVLPCCYDLRGELPLGRFPEQSLGEIWNGSAYTLLRQAHAAGRISEYPLCAGCGQARQPALLKSVVGEYIQLYKHCMG